MLACCSIVQSEFFVVVYWMTWTNQIRCFPAKIQIMGSRQKGGEVPLHLSRPVVSSQIGLTSPTEFGRIGVKQCSALGFPAPICRLPHRRHRCRSTEAQIPQPHRSARSARPPSCPLCLRETLCRSCGAQKATTMAATHSGAGGGAQRFQELCTRLQMTPAFAASAWEVVEKVSPQVEMVRPSRTDRRLPSAVANTQRD